MRSPISTPEADAYSLEDFAGIEGLTAVKRLAGALADPRFSQAQRLVIVDQALALISSLYVHLPMKRAMLGVDPEQALLALRNRVDDAGLADDERLDPPLSDRAFQAQLVGILTSLCDLHTIYVAPKPYRRWVAFLPLLIEVGVAPDGTRRYVASKVASTVRERDALLHAEVTHWNGIPIDRAVEVLAERTGGAHADARLARAIDRLTLRWLGTGTMPNESWVTLSYRATDGAEREARCPWLVGRPAAPDAVAAPSAQALLTAEDSGTEMVRRVKRALFADDGVGRGGGSRTSDEPWRSRRPDALSCWPFPGPDGPFGYLRVWTFHDDDVDAFVEEARRMLSVLPPDGLVIDIRGNPGGYIAAADRLLRLLSPDAIEPEPLQFLATPTTLELAQALDGTEDAPLGLDKTLASLRLALQTGEGFSRAVPVDDLGAQDGDAQAYQGPKVLVFDALSYSSSDVFAAGFQDHGLGAILATADRTGGGGGNPWDFDQLRSRLPRSLRRLPSASTPEGTPLGAPSFAVTVRRMLRVGPINAGRVLEAFGVAPELDRGDEIHEITVDDLADGNQALKDKAAEMLGNEALFPGCRIAVRFEPARPRWRLQTTALERVGVRRPSGTTMIDEPNGKRVADDGEDVLLLGYRASLDDAPSVSLRPQRA